MDWNATTETGRFTMIPDSPGIIATDETSLSDLESRQQTTLYGPWAILLGVIFAAVGSAMLAAMYGYLFPGQISPKAPRMIIIPIGMVFVLIGFLMLVHGLRASVAEAFNRRRWDRNPWQPWMGDFAWNPEGTASTGAAGAFRDLFAALFMVLFLTPFNWVTFFSDAPWFFRIFFGLITMVFNAVSALLLGRGAYRLLQAIKFGKTGLRYDRFPFFLGERMDAKLYLPENVAAARSLDLELRCVEERVVRDGKSTKIQGFRIYSETRSTPLTFVATPRGRALPVSFPLPKGNCGTALGGRPPRYWELIVTAELPGIDYKTNLLVPVYDKPGL